MGDDMTGGSRDLPSAMVQVNDLAARGEIQAASRMLRELRDEFPTHSEFWLRAALMMRNAGDLDAAERLLDEACARFPFEPAPFIDAAALAERRGDRLETVRRCEEARSRFPDQVSPYVLEGVALRDLWRLDEAEALLCVAWTRFPDEPDPLVQLCTVAERRADWADAARRCALARARFPKEIVPYILGLMALRGLNRLDEAEAVLNEAVRRFPSDARFTFEHARILLARERWEEAAQCWQALTIDFPDHSGAPIGAATALRRLGRLEEADTVIEAAMARMPQDEELAMNHALNTIACDDWRLTVERLRSALVRIPGSQTIRRGLYDAQLRVADAGGAPAPVPDTPIADKDRELVLNFESLGGGGHGCEFGIFQRSLGAEPLGLLRWADVHPNQIITALETDLDGVGEPEFTRVFVPNHDEAPEYWTTDTRYHMAMRSFVLVKDVPLEAMSHMVTRRQRFLRRKLLEDLKTGSKIFVYKNLRENLRDDLLARLLAAVRRHGDNTLFFIGYQEEGHPNGTVRVAGEGLLIGYIDHFSHAPGTDAFLGFAHEQLLILCRRAFALWTEEKARAKS